MSKIDWSLAPNWATHALVKLHNPGIGGVHWSYFIDGEHRISPDGLWFHPDGYRVAEERPRNVKPKQWSGPEDGLPPVGTQCQMMENNSGPMNVEILMYRSGYVVVYCADAIGPPFLVQLIEHSRFQPVKTPQQLAAEKREYAIRELMDIAQVDCRVTAARLVDAGFKREVF